MADDSISRPVGNRDMRKEKII